MNLIQWAAENLDFRCLFLTTKLNYEGETHDVFVCLLPNDGTGYNNRKVQISRNQSNLPPIIVYLDQIQMMTSNLYYFETEEGKSGSLIIQQYEKEDNGC